MDATKRRIPYPMRLLAERNWLRAHSVDPGIYSVRKTAPSVDPWIYSVVNSTPHRARNAHLRHEMAGHCIAIAVPALLPTPRRAPKPRLPVPEAKNKGVTLPIFQATAFPLRRSGGRRHDFDHRRRPRAAPPEIHKITESSTYAFRRAWRSRCQSDVYDEAKNEGVTLLISLKV